MNTNIIKRIHINPQSKGSLGKSFEAEFRTAWLDYHSIPWNGSDLDDRHHSFADRHPEQVQSYKLGDDDDSKSTLLGLFRNVSRSDAPVHKQGGHHPIIVMQCGPIRHHVNAKEQALARPFKHVVIPRPTNFRLPPSAEKPEMHELYAALANDKARNNLIYVDLLRSIKANRSPILLTERTSQVDEFASRLTGLVKHIVVLKGGMGAKQRRAIAEQLIAIPEGEERVLLATGRYIGEGFDDARLDTLFLAMPVSWRGTLQQYVGRLHRLHDSKREVIVYDYVDGCLPVFSAMYSKRVRGYEAVGYVIQDE